MGLLQEGLNLIDAFVDRSQTHTAAQYGAPSLAQIAQTLTQAAAKEHVLIQIQPKALEFLDNRPVSHHVVAALLALQHRNLQVLHLTPPRFQVPTVMSITGELVSITTATRPALPINGARLPAYASRFAFSSAQLGCQLFF